MLYVCKKKKKLKIFWLFSSLAANLDFFFFNSIWAQLNRIETQIWIAHSGFANSAPGSLAIENVNT